MTGGAASPRSEKVLELATVQQSIHHIEACHYQPFCPMKHLTRNERSPRLLVHWMNRDESRGREREAQALSRPAKEVCKQARSSTYSGRVLRPQVTRRQALELTPSFFPQASAAIRGPNMASSLVSENLYPVFRATEMKTNFVGVRESLNSGQLIDRPI